MPLTSDVVIDAGKFDPANNTEQANDLNRLLIERAAPAPKWYEVGAAKYREMVWAGETLTPVPTVSPDGANFKIASREAGRDIPCRVIYPSSRKTDEERNSCKGSFLHFHGGGWTLGDERSQDRLLQFYADTGDLAAISIGYRLGPECPFPRGPEDCIDAGEHVFKNSEKDYGGPLKFIGGESAGGHLSVVTLFHLLKTYPDLHILGLVLNFGCYDLTKLPLHINMAHAAIIPETMANQFSDSFMPNMSLAQKKTPAVSPFYEDLEPFRGRLPSALFTCGTEDPLLDDSVLMGMRWMMAGGTAFIKIYTGAPHGFIIIPPAMLKEAEQCYGDIRTYIVDLMEMDGEKA
ncbi:hypothetical protein HYFRA_00004384 [Hymenoscyphus fraxineus]|uniref:Alpha/beta hydrolase fold-3 domain-containing protein n=1 Tax=Hymenoscyphus fraxineus TaxID=746836 RepID=A0A9N9PUF3_9HELO|nr:hypothetical protein HYFRA_00004384 [Hymenoscyphus fraxineus]